MVSPVIPPLRSSARACAVALLVVSMFGAAVARADDADALIKRGVELRRAGKDEAALEQFRRAYDVTPSPRALAQMGLAEQALGRWVDGEAHLVKALEAAQDPWIGKYRETLQSSRGEIARHLGWLLVTGGPSGAQLRLDGRLAGTLPLDRPLRLPAATITLDAIADGHVLATRTVTVQPGETANEDLRPPAASATAPPAVPRAAGLAASGGSPTDLTASPKRATGDHRTLAWISTGTAVAAAITGGALLYLGNRDASEYNSRKDCTTTNTACDDLHISGERKQTAGVVSLSIAGVLGATAAWVFLSSEHADDHSRRLACAPTLLEPGAACALHF
jgi:hypothetical protein